MFSVQCSVFSSVVARILVVTLLNTENWKRVLSRYERNVHEQPSQRKLEKKEEK